MDARVVSPEKDLFDGEASEVYARSTEGEIGLLPGHQPVVLLLAPAPLRIVDSAGTSHVWAIRSGFLEFSDNQLTVLADQAEEASSKEEAERLLAG